MKESKGSEIEKKLPEKKLPEKLVLINPSRLNEKQKLQLSNFLKEIEYEESISAHSAATS